MTPPKDYSSGLAARQKIQSPSLTTGLASHLEDSMRKMDLKHEALIREIQEHLDESDTLIENDVAYGHKQIGKKCV